MKNKRLQYRLYIIFTAISIVGFLGFLIAALIVREKQAEYLAWFLVAGVFLLLSIINLFLLIKFIQSKYYKKLVQDLRKKGLQNAKEKNKLKSYFLNCETTNLEVTFKKLLEDFEYENLDEGKIFYRNTKNIYKKKKEAFDTFYLLNENQIHSFDLNEEAENIKRYEDIVVSFFKSKGKDTNFINSIIVFQHESLVVKEKDFYYAFTGLWDADLYNARFIRNNSFTYCGIDKLTKQTYFYKPLKSDGGTEVDLNYLIIKEMQLTETV